MIPDCSCQAAWVTTRSMAGSLQCSAQLPFAESHETLTFTFRVYLPWLTSGIVNGGGPWGLLGPKTSNFVTADRNRKTAATSADMQPRS